MRGELQSWTALIVALTGFVTGTTTGLVALIRTWRTNGRVTDVARDVTTVARATYGVDETSLASHLIGQGGDTPEDQPPGNGAGPG